MAPRTNIGILRQEIEWLSKVIDQAIRSYLLQEGHEQSWLGLAVPDLTREEAPYAVFVSERNLGVFERLAMALALAPHLCPEALDVFFGKNQIYDRGFTEFGGVVDKEHSGFLPTGQTFCFLLLAADPELRLKANQILGTEGLLVKEEVLAIEETALHIPRLNGILGLRHRWLHYFLTGETLETEFGETFPAHKITSHLDWDEVVLDELVMEQVNEINAWLEHGDTLMHQWGLKHLIKPGYRSLFYGPPGTGKTLTATLLGKASKRDVYRVDLSMVVSKYIGETEKNLSQLFRVARDKSWILFFDEADALFGKRTATQSSNDRHANQQTAHLLQQIEDFPGVVILASNLRANMDEAFTRRFQSIIHFNMPNATERYQLWQQAFSGTCSLSGEINLLEVAEDYELAGGAIINVLRSCALSAVRRNDSVVTKAELLAGIKKEFRKENKTILVK